MSILLNDSAILNEFIPTSISKIGVTSFVETLPFKPIFPPKIDELTFSNVTFSSLIDILPFKFFNSKLS